MQDGPEERPEPIKWLVPVDASQNAVKAFHYCCKLVGRHDEITVYHVTNPGRYPDMAPMYQPDVIKSQFESEAIKGDIAMTHKWQFVVEEKKKDGKKIREMIRDYAEHHADIVVLGSFGAKFERKTHNDKNEATFHCIGTTAAMVTRGCKAQVIVVSPNANDLAIRGQRRFLVAVDGSDLAHHAYEKACSLMRKGDYLQVVFIETDANFGKEICNAYSHDMLSSKIKGIARSFPLQGEKTGENIAKQILGIAESDGIEFGRTDILVHGSHGLSVDLPAASEEEATRQQYLQKRHEVEKRGSVAHALLENSRSAVMVATVDSLVGGLHYTKHLESYHAWFTKARGIIRTRSQLDEQIPE